MKFTRLTLENIRSYESEIVEFPEGNILVHGPNGAGKTSLLMGIFGALFSSSIRNVGNNDFNIDELVRRGADKGRVELVFEVEGVEYTSEWHIYTTSTPSRATLESDALSGPVSGITDVRQQVVELLGMDAEDFSASVYVKQGEINRLLDTDTRTDLIDGLLNLDNIDEYIEFAKKARTGAGRVRRDNESARNAAHEKIKSDFDRDESVFEDEIRELAQEIRRAESEKEEVEEFVEELKDEVRFVEARIEAYDETQAELAEAKAELEGKREGKADRRQQKEDAERAIAEERSYIDELESEVAQLDEQADYDLSTPEQADDARDDVLTALTDAKTDRAGRKNDLENAERTLEELRSELEEARDELAGLEDERSTTKDELQSLESELEAERESLDERIQRRNELTAEFLLGVDTLDAVTDDTRPDIEARVDELDDEREQLGNELTEANVRLEALRDDRDDAVEELSDVESTLEEKGEQLASVREELTDVEDEVEAAEEEFEARISQLREQGAELDIDVSADDLSEVRDERIPNRLDELTERRQEVSNRIAELDERTATLESNIEEIRELGEAGKCPRCKQEIDEARVEDEIQELQSELDAEDHELADLREKQESLDDEKSQVEALRKDVRDAIDFETTVLVERRDEQSALEDDVETLEAEVSQLRSEAKELESERNALTQEISDHEEEVQSLRSETDDLEQEVERGEAVVEAFDAVEEQRAVAEELVEDVEELESTRSELDDDIDETEEEIDSLETDIEEQRALVEEREADLQDADAKVDAVESMKEIVEEAVEAHGEIDERRSDVEALQQQIRHTEETIDGLNEQIASLQGDIEELEAELGDENRGDLQEKLEQYEEVLDERQANVEEYEAKIQDLRDERISLEKDLEQLRGLKADIESYESKERWAADLVSELETVIDVYHQSKSDLRQQYLAYLREYTNDIFSQVYRNGSYQQVLIREEGHDGSHEYEIELLRDDGTREDPSNASGGERAIVNLALRAGIYRLMAELAGGNRGRLPPLILDEPTTFLDEGHVGQLDEMLDTIRGWDVPQIIVVSHDERLIHGADHECRVRIDEETNASTVQMRTADDVGNTGERGTGDD